jgi:pimeloyl-ACP methyl ester carboxylesterase
VTVQDVEAYAQAREALVAVDEEVRLEAPSQGEGDVAVLLPGFGTDVSAFARQIPALAKSYRVVGVNPRGVGLSDAPEQEVYSVAQSAADVATVTEVTGSSPAHVIGTSLGAAVAIELALAHPEKVRSLALIAPFSHANGRLLAVVEAWGKIAASAGAQLLADTLLPWLFSAAFLEDETARERTHRGLTASLARVSPAALPRAAAGLREWSGTRTDALGKISVPTLVIGAGEDLLTPDAGALAAAIPGARFVEIPGAGHAVGLEAPETVNAALLEHFGSAH